MEIYNYVDCNNNHQAYIYALYAVESYHNNHYEDRRWHFMCKNVELYPLHSPIIIGRETRIILTSPSRSCVMPIMWWREWAVTITIMRRIVGGDAMLMATKPRIVDWLDTSMAGV